MYDENILITNLLYYAHKINRHEHLKAFLIHRDIIKVFNNGIISYKTSKELTIRDICDIEVLLGKEIIKIPTEKEWKQIHRKEKLEKINKL